MNWTGLAAATWDVLGGDEAGIDYRFFARYIRAGDGPALDVGCGTGRLLLRYLQEGLDVDGMDSSTDMLRLCAEKAEGLGLRPALFGQRMEQLALPRRYATIFVPGGAFGLITQPASAVKALRRFNAHLLSGGRLLLTVFSPFGPHKALSPYRPNGWSILASAELGNGMQVVHDFRRDSSDVRRQLLRERKRYRVIKNGAVLQEETLLMEERWYRPEELERLLIDAGFRTVSVKGDFTEAGWRPQHRMMVVVASK